LLCVGNAAPIAVIIQSLKTHDNAYRSARKHRRILGVKSLKVDKY
jgi:hypothetical protein